MDGLSSALDSLRRSQLEARIQELNRLILQYRSEINYYNEQLRVVDQSYESVSGFKGSVQRSQECFSEVSSAKSSVLEQVNSVSRNNTAAKKYYSGMKRVLTGTGTKIASKLYSFLLLKIRNEQASLINKSNDYAGKINYFNRMLGNAQSELAQKTQELQNL